MDDGGDWEIPDAVRPRPEAYDYDIERTLDSVLLLRAEVPEDSFTASILGTERAGHAVVIDDRGLVLTIGYLIAEASNVWLIANNGTAVSGHVVAYDFETGFGLVQALGRLDVPPIQIGRSGDSGVGSQIVLAGHGGRENALTGKVVSRREFAGYWEYVLDEAIFITPAHPNWGGAAAVDGRGRLIGIGSLFVQNAHGGDVRADGNMIVPIDLLPPILDDLLTYGSARRVVRPWLGIYVADTEDKHVVVGLAEGGPADRGGVEVGDVILEVAGAPIGDLADLFRSIWALGPAGVDVPLTVWRDGEPQRVAVHSADRNDFLRSPKLH